MLLEELKDKKILILGLGREGLDTFFCLRKLFPKKILGIADSNEKVKEKIKKKEKVRWHLGKNYLKALKKYDLIIKSPGIPIHLPEIERAYREKRITSQTELFFKNCPAKIIGITGTKGKGTTSFLLEKILRKGGYKPFLIGNIERPALGYLLKTYKLALSDPKVLYIYEVSSHQLYKLKRSPQIAIFLNLYPAHLDFFKSFKEYILAKTNICRYQKSSDILIYNDKDPLIKKIIKKSPAKKIPISSALPYSKKISQGPTIVHPTILKAVFLTAKVLNVPQKIIFETIKKFKGLPHRLEFVGEFKKIKFYNDSLATIPQSTIFAIKALAKNLQTIFLGGSENYTEVEELAEKILKSQIKNIIFFPDTGEKIYQKIIETAERRSNFKKRIKKIKFFFVDNMKDAVKIAYQNTEKGKACLLSPAYPSFSLFRDYKERGKLFKKYVKLYAKKKKIS